MAGLTTCSSRHVARCGNLINHNRTCSFLRAVLRHAAPCHAAPCCAVPRRAVPRRAVPCHAMPCPALPCPAQAICFHSDTFPHLDTMVRSGLRYPLPDLLLSSFELRSVRLYFRRLPSHGNVSGECRTRRRAARSLRFDSPCMDACIPDLGCCLLDRAALQGEKPLAKFCAIKFVVFISWWQQVILTVLQVLKHSERILFEHTNTQVWWPPVCREGILLRLQAFEHRTNTSGIDIALVGAGHAALERQLGGVGGGGR
eukprot:SAG11_NODE_4684_length_1807_cov_1.466628_2_plen_257_part_00